MNIYNVRVATTKTSYKCFMLGRITSIQDKIYYDSRFRIFKATFFPKEMTV